MRARIPAIQAKVACEPVTSRVHPRPRARFAVIQAKVACESVTSRAEPSHWSGNRPVSGAASTGALTATNNSYTLTCNGAGGSASQSASVTVDAPPPPPAPSVSLSANPGNVDSGGSSTLSWSSNSARRTA